MSNTPTDWLVGILIILIIYLLITWHRNEQVIENHIFKKVNEIRAKVGVHNLARNTYLDSLAKSHSMRMTQENSLQHSYDNVGENIFNSPVWYWTQGCGLTITNGQIAECMIKGWKNSPGHYSNMINPRYSMTGIGVSCTLFECKGTQNFT